MIQCTLLCHFNPIRNVTLTGLKITEWCGTIVVAFFVFRYISMKLLLCKDNKVFFITIQISAERLLMFA